MTVDYQAGSNLLNRTLDHAVENEGLKFTEALAIHFDALPGVLKAAVELRREEQAREAARRPAAPLPSPLGMWASFARNGRRVHALVTYAPYEYESACGLTSAEVGSVYAEEPDWDADVPSPPKPCPACRKAGK